MLTVDLNADLGEGMNTDESMMKFISSANIACGGHTGDEDSVRYTAMLAQQHGVAIGAHPSFPDREHFGRVDLMEQGFELEKLEESLIEQIAGIKEICAQLGLALHHIKPHGALYNRAAWDRATAIIICSAIKKTDHRLFLYGMSQTILATAAREADLSFVAEAFADRVYLDEKTLKPRISSNALISEIQPAMDQALDLVERGLIHSEDEKKILIHADTICIHSDTPNAVQMAGAIRQALQTRGIRIMAP